MISKEFIGFITVCISVGTAAAYIRHVLAGKITPHIFTWIIWTLTVGIAAAARMSDDAGPGSWGQWVNAVSCALIAVVAIKNGEKDITRTDFLALIATLTAIPAWIMTQSPLVATVIVTVIDLVGYYPTFRKSYRRPYQEAIYNYTAGNVINILLLYANLHYSLTTMLFPAVMLCANTVMIAMLWWRRGQVRKAATPSVNAARL